MTREQLEEFIEAKAANHVENIIESGLPGSIFRDFKEGSQLLLPPLLTALAALEFYSTGFSKKLTESMMGVNTPALGDGGLIARKALAEVAKLLEVKP